MMNCPSFIARLLRVCIGRLFRRWETRVLTKDTRWLCYVFVFGVGLVYMNSFFFFLDWDWD
jgi:threonine/homoserine efflux transporter RhtA